MLLQNGPWMLDGPSKLPHTPARASELLRAMVRLENLHDLLEVLGKKTS